MKVKRQVRKQKPKPHIIVPDTSILWHEDKQHVVDPIFDNFWNEYSSNFPLELYIPEVVRGELLFQQTTSALKSLSRVNQAIDEIQNVTRKKYSHRITINRIKQEIERKFNLWASTKNANIIDTPTNTIVWHEIIRQSIWREPPFEFDVKHKDQEKGFRDALILETFVNFCKNTPHEYSIAFLCKDKLLRGTVENRLKSNNRVSVYELIDDFKTYLDLTQEKLEDVFIRGIIRRASNKFYTKGNSDCLYFRDNVKGKLKEKYKRYFDNPEGSENALLSKLSSIQGVTSWEPLDQGTFWISRSRFINKNSKSLYIWENTVTFVRQFSRIRIVASLKGKEYSEVYILLLPFSIVWSAKVTSDGRFREYSYLTDELKMKDFRMRTEDDIKEWKLEGGL